MKGLARAERWEDLLPPWEGPDYEHLRLRHHESVATGHLVGGGVNSCIEVVDWDGDGGRDLLFSSWDACYGGGVRLFEEKGKYADGTPRLAPGRRVLGSVGYVSAVPDGGRFHLVATSRLRPEPRLFPNLGGPRAPSFGDPLGLELEADWLHGRELRQNARFVDLDGDGRHHLVLATDYMDDYWPDGVEWFAEGYRPYTPDRVWRGGAIRGHFYLFRNRGTVLEPDLARGVPLTAGGRPIEVYGMPAMTFGDFRGSGALDLVVGDMLDRLYFFPRTSAGAFGPGAPLRDGNGAEIILYHCFHCPVAVDWDGDGQLDLLVSAENGFVTFLRNTGRLIDGAPSFSHEGRVKLESPELHPGVFVVPAVGDFTGGGRRDLVVGNTSGEIVFYPNLGPPEAPAFGAPTLLKSEGEPIRIQAGPNGSVQGPSEAKFGYTNPTVADWDGDGRADLLVSDILGRHIFYRNAGGAGVPEFETARPLTFEGRPLITVWRVRPAVADWLGDGTLSYVCLDEHAVLSSYRRLSPTCLGEKRYLCFTDSSPIRFTEDRGAGGQGRIKLCLCDWTGDGRYDLVVGTHCRASLPPGPGGMPRRTTGRAGVFLLENQGTNAEPRFAPPRPIRYRGEPIMLGMHSAAPEAIDWRVRGLPDLLVGAENGSLLWFPRADLSW